MYSHQQFPSEMPPKFERAIKWMLLICGVAIVLSYCSSCYTPAKAKRQALRAMTQHPEEVLPTLRKLAPCITVNVDTFYTTVDTTITVDCPDTTAPQYFTVHDTVTHNRTIRVPYTVTLPARTVVKYIKDSAEVMECNLRNARLIGERDAAVKREQAAAAKLDKVTATRNWLWLALIVCVLTITHKTWMPVVGRMGKLIPVILIITLNSCSSDNDFKNGKKQLESMGYTNVENTGYGMFCCSKDDGFSTGFKAKDKSGNTVEGCFCSDMLKGVTIRFK